MNKKVLDDKTKYHRFRHHAWAGLGLLSVLVVIINFVTELREVLVPFVFVILIYIVVSLLFTYRFYKAASSPVETTTTEQDIELEKIKMDAKIEKKRLKIEKKKIKTKAKTKK